MSFIRPELAQRIARWRVPIIAAGIGAGALVLLWRAWQAGSVLAGVAGAIGLIAALVLLRDAVRRVWLTSRPPAAGIVVIDEARVGYLGPERGGFLSIPDLVRVSVVPGGAHNAACWRLEDCGGLSLDIPFGARGAADLPDALAQLPGIDFARGFEAGTDSGRADAPAVIWQRPPETARTLVSGPPPR